MPKYVRVRQETRFVIFAINNLCKLRCLYFLVCVCVLGSTHMRVFMIELLLLDY